jgi:hypothetical protein
VANGTAEIFTPDGDADEERGIQLAELYANLHALDGSLRTTDNESGYIPEQRTPTHDALVDEIEDQATPQATTIEGGKALYGTFASQIRFAGGLSVKGVIRGREVVRMNRRMSSTHLGRYVVPRVLPGGR